MLLLLYTCIFFPHRISSVPVKTVLLEDKSLKASVLIHEMAPGIAITNDMRKEYHKAYLRSEHDISTVVITRIPPLDPEEAAEPYRYILQEIGPASIKVNLLINIPASVMKIEDINHLAINFCIYSKLQV